MRQIGDGVRQFVVRSLSGGKWSVRILAAFPDRRPVACNFVEEPTRVLVTAVDRTGHESESVEVTK
jgi:hypothetical protein